MSNVNLKEKVLEDIGAVKQRNFFRKLFGWGRKKTKETVEKVAKDTTGNLVENPKEELKESILISGYRDYIKNLDALSIENVGEDRRFAVLEMLRAYSENGYLQRAVSVLCGEVTGIGSGAGVFQISDSSGRDVQRFLEDLGVLGNSFVSKMAKNIVLTGMYAMRAIIDYTSKNSGIVGLEYIDPLRVVGVVYAEPADSLDGGVKYSSNITDSCMPDLLTEVVARLFNAGISVTEKTVVAYIIDEEDDFLDLAKQLLKEAKDMSMEGSDSRNIHDFTGNRSSKMSAGSGFKIIPAWEFLYVYLENNIYNHPLGFPLFHDCVPVHQKQKHISDLKMLTMFMSVPRDVLSMSELDKHTSPVARYNALNNLMNIYTQINSSGNPVMRDDFSEGVGKPIVLPQGLEHNVVTPSIGGVIRGLSDSEEGAKNELLACLGIPTAYIVPDSQPDNLSGEALAKLSRSIGVQVATIQSLCCGFVKKVVDIHLGLRGYSGKDVSITMQTPISVEDGETPLDTLERSLEKVGRMLEGLTDVEVKRKLVRYCVENKFISSVVGEILDADLNSGEGVDTRGEGARDVSEGVRERILPTVPQKNFEGDMSKDGETESGEEKKVESSHEDVLASHFSKYPLLYQAVSFIREVSNRMCKDNSLVSISSCKRVGDEEILLLFNDDHLEFNVVNGKVAVYSSSMYSIKNSKEEEEHSKEEEEHSKEEED